MCAKYVIVTDQAADSLAYCRPDSCRPVCDRLQFCTRSPGNGTTSSTLTFYDGLLGTLCKAWQLVLNSSFTQYIGMLICCHYCTTTELK